MKENVEIIRHGDIQIFNYERINNRRCGCGNLKICTMVINGIYIDLCEKCLADIIHCAVDTLQ